MLRIRTREEKKEEVCFLPRLQGGFDASLQFSRTKKPCGCLCTSEDNKMRQKDGVVINGLRGEIILWQRYISEMPSPKLVGRESEQPSL